jgi:polyhydroxyalkanoate synthesis regulator phasin
MGKKFAAAGLAAAVALGSLGVAALNPLGVAGAQDPAAEAPAAGERQGPLKRALDQLVADGTVTQEQADAVVAATKAEAEAGRAERKERRQGNRQELLATVAEAMGSTPEEVKAGLKDGTSLAAQADAAGVDRQVVDDALTALLTGRIDDAVAEGRLSEERAAKAREHVDQAVDRIIDADGQGRGDGPGRGRFRPGN